MASPRRSLYILAHLSLLNQLHRPMYGCRETLREMHAFPLDKTIQIAALGRSAREDDIRKKDARILSLVMRVTVTVNRICMHCMH